MADPMTEKLALSPDAFANAVGDETVILHIRDGVYYGLDPIGTLIWNGLSGGQPLGEICAGIASDYGVPIEQVEGDSAAFVEQLKASNIVVAGR